MTRPITGLAMALALPVLSLSLCAGVVAQTSSLSKFDTFLARQAAGHSAAGRLHVIARFDRPLGAAERLRLRSLGVDVTRGLPIIHSAALSLPAHSLSRLAALPFVSRLSADLCVKKCDEFIVESSGAAVATSQFGVDGTGVGVAVIDSGVFKSLDLGPATDDSTPRLLTGANFVPPSGAATGNGKPKPTDTDDACGHGTHIAGIIAGNGKASSTDNCFRTFYGVARNATIVPVRVLDANGQGTVSQVISGIQWVVDNRATGNIRVINLSLGHPVGESYATDPLCQAVEAAWKAGIVVVCSAGNSGRLQDWADSSLDNEGYGTAYGSVQSPGNDPCVITVGAMKTTDMVFTASGAHTHNRANDTIATYSSRGPARLDLVLKPDIVAPGNKIISLEASPKSTLAMVDGGTNEILMTDYVKGPAPKISTRYFRLSGTSMAAPVVSGAVALMLQKSPGLTPDTVKARLMLSADKWTQPGGGADPLTYGAGYLNIAAALGCTAVPCQPVSSPTVTLCADGTTVINIDRALWGKAFDGTSALWGIAGVTDLRAIWGHTAISADSTNTIAASSAIHFDSVDLERAIWGHSVWDDRAIWGHTMEGVDLSCIVIRGE